MQNNWVIIFIEDSEDNREYNTEICPNPIKAECESPLYVQAYSIRRKTRENEEMKMEIPAVLKSLKSLKTQKRTISCSKNVQNFIGALN